MTSLAPAFLKCFSLSSRDLIAVTPPYGRLELTWTPYLLDPRSPDDGITVKDYYTAKYGPEAAALQSSPENPLMKAAKNIGLPVFNDQRRIFPTITSHRLLELAQHQVSTGASPDLNVDCLVENLFHAYFIDAENLNDVDVLVKHGVEVGMEGAVVQEFLLSDVGVDHVKAWDKHAKRKLKVPSVPHFVFQTPEEGAEPVRSGGDAECLQAALKKVLDETGSLL